MLAQWLRFLRYRLFRGYGVTYLVDCRRIVAVVWSLQTHKGVYLQRNGISTTWRGLVKYRQSACSSLPVTFRNLCLICQYIKIGRDCSQRRGRLMVVYNMLLWSRLLSIVDRCANYLVYIDWHER